MRVFLVLGTRPQIIKSSLLISLMNGDSELDFKVIHTGQHHDYAMSQAFFEELGLPSPAANLGVGSGSHAYQTATMMTHLEHVLLDDPPDIVLVPGDTNSALAAALVAAKMNIPVAHIEAGARSYDMRMPEEVNRRLVDHCSSLLFTPTDRCTRNLIGEGISQSCIHQVGDTMYDVLLQQLPKVEASDILVRLGLNPKSYVLLTVHRPENVDRPVNLANIVVAASKFAPLMTVFPVHPRTKKQLKRTKLHEQMKGVYMKMIKPVGYHESLKLIREAKLVMTDSGGVQKEAFWLGTPCVTLRETTEWPETIELKSNSLAGSNLKKIIKSVEDALRDGAPKLIGVNPFGDGAASERILEVLKGEDPNSR